VRKSEAKVAKAAKAEQKAAKKAVREKAQRDQAERQRLQLQRRNVKVGYYSNTWHKTTWWNISIDGMTRDEDIREMAEGLSKKRKLKLSGERTNMEARSCVLIDA
jgi:hypothetical protein